MTYTKKTTEEIKTTILLNVIQNVDLINDANVGSGLDLFTTAIAQELGEQYDDLDVVYDSSRITTATGTDLEEIGAIVGVERDAGANSTGTVSFIRNIPATGAFVISTGTIVATQPNTGEEQLQFVTTEDKTFYTSISDEENTFVDGIYEYAFDARFVNSISAIDDGITTYVQNTDYSLSTDYEDLIIDPDDVELINDCETAGDWTEGGEAAACTANVAEYYEGSQSLNMIKSSTADKDMSYQATFATTFDMTDKSLFVSIYIKDSTELAKIDDVDLVVSDQSDFSANYTKNYANSDLSVGWNRLYVDRSDSTITTTGNPNYTVFKYIKIEVNTVNNTDTFTAGELMMDFWFISNYENYVGDIIQWDKDQSRPADGATIYIDYVPLSVDISITSSAVGAVYNVSEGSVNYMITLLSNIDRLYNYSALANGLDEETDAEYRESIYSASDLANVATVNAIKANVEALSFVSTATVTDLPETAQTEEAHVYDASSKKFNLDNKVAIDDANLVISNSAGGSADYIKDTDYQLNDFNEIDFDIGGTAPTGGNTVYVDYHYNKLGYFNIMVSGVLGTLNSLQVTEIEDLLDESVKAAGVQYVLAQPALVPVVVAASIEVQTGFTASDIISAVETAVETYINALEIGDDVLLSGVIQTIMNTSGVENTTVTDIAGGGAVDKTISSTQLARASTMTITV